LSLSNRKEIEQELREERENSRKTQEEVTRYQAASIDKPKPKPKSRGPWFHFNINRECLI